MDQGDTLLHFPKIPDVYYNIMVSLHLVSSQLHLYLYLLYVIVFLIYVLSYTCIFEIVIVHAIYIYSILFTV